MKTTNAKRFSVKVKAISIQNKENVLERVFRVFSAFLFMCILVKIKYVVSICLNWIPTPKNDNIHQATPVIYEQLVFFILRHQGVVWGVQNFFKRLTYTFYHGGRK